MDFSTGQIHHVFNRGNNSQKLFFSRENYLFFLDKIRKSILPYADVLAWCLMPNHFHLMISVNQVEIDIEEKALAKNSEGFTLSESLTKPSQRTLNDSI